MNPGIDPAIGQLDEVQRDLVPTDDSRSVPRARYEPRPHGTTELADLSEDKADGHSSDFLQGYGRDAASLPNLLWCRKTFDNHPPGPFLNLS